MKKLINKPEDVVTEALEAMALAHADLLRISYDPNIIVRADAPVRRRFSLAHEMAHVWQQTHGTPPRRCYHDRQWAAKMKEIGLQPSTTGEPGGKETGQSVTHYIIPGGPYATAAATALMRCTKLSARRIVEESMKIAGDICIYTNQNVTYEELE